jgi:hypothetical protein
MRPLPESFDDLKPSVFAALGGADAANLLDPLG